VADPETLALVQSAADLESREQWPEAVAAWSLAVARRPALAPVQLRLAQAQIRAGRPGDAIAVLEPITARAPGEAAAWLALGVAYSLAGRQDDAIRAGERAVALAPGVSAAHLGHGDILHRAGDPPGAERAYRRALALSPGNADALNKLAALARAEGRRGDAEALLTEALAGHPDHPYARINLAMIAIRRHRVDEARRLLASMQAQTGLPPGVRAAASEALAAIDERERLRPPVDEALASDGSGPIELALRTLEPEGVVDGPLLTALSGVVERFASTPSIEGRFGSLRVPSSAWPALEAHHVYRFDGDPRARTRSLRLVAGTEPAASPEDLDVVHYARVAASRCGERAFASDGVACEAWLRWTHARLVRHRDDYWPGMLNPIGNSPLGGSDHAHTPPRAIAGTLRHAFADVLPRLPPGGRRATAALLAILWIHPFLNGNKRLARTVANEALAAAGLMPHLNVPGADRTIPAIAQEVRRTGDALPLASWLAMASRRAAELDVRYARVVEP
jgi:Flp pilus assembly protein TadD